MSISILRLQLTTSNWTMEAKPWLRGCFTAAVVASRIGQLVDAHIPTSGWPGTSSRPLLGHPLSVCSEQVFHSHLVMALGGSRKPDEGASTSCRSGPLEAPDKWMVWFLRSFKEGPAFHYLEDTLKSAPWPACQPRPYSLGPVLRWVTKGRLSEWPAGCCYRVPGSTGSFPHSLALHRAFVGNWVTPTVLILSSPFGSSTQSGFPRSHTGGFRMPVLAPSPLPWPPSQLSSQYRIRGRDSHRFTRLFIAGLCCHAVSCDQCCFHGVWEMWRRRGQHLWPWTWVWSRDTRPYWPGCFRRTQVASAFQPRYPQHLRRAWHKMHSGYVRRQHRESWGREMGDGDSNSQPCLCRSPVNLKLFQVQN